MSCPPLDDRPDPATHGLEMYCVGGAVRDARLGIDSVDRDWVVVGATVERMLARGFRQVGRDFPVFLHPESHEEYALARTERKSGRGYTGFEVHADPGVTLEEDLRRRDLTLNAMACSVQGELIDPFGGAADCDAGCLRHVSEAFVEDPLRVLRTARFLARFAPRGFFIAEATRALMLSMVARGEMRDLVAERVWQETARALAEASPEAYFMALHECGALSELMPALADHETLAIGRLAAGAPPADAMQRFALFTSVLEEATLETLCEALRVPNGWREEAVLLVRSLAWLERAEAFTPEAVGSWLQAIDGWRRPERVSRVLDTLALLWPEVDRASLEQAHAAGLAVSPQTLMAEGYRGGELGRMIGQRRREALAAALGAGPQ
ncbi:tRNA nucleotidyltransferase (CCA-adding enzyme) [Kushneria sinocarnis]|uniref:tRNA nucleotidyltransferase (CCA-adding enzyme) n=1 Tax=Kushneria sinocarnis TaxID=595502 RepID=A0A420WZ76_9GAMM|nr:polynucleotide adenylyltransferase [Kushneria sinocarnis]RKR06592.1 tRNA nucleotidyltransferase (CCA-adding enzyme) [Kushneria sinocarnis]